MSLSYKADEALEKIGDYFKAKRDELSARAKEREFKRQLALNVAAEMYDSEESTSVNANHLRNYVNDVTEKLF